MKSFRVTTGPAWALTLNGAGAVFAVLLCKPYLAHLGFFDGFYAIESGKDLRSELADALVSNPIVGTMQFELLLLAAVLASAGPAVSLYWLCRKYINVLVRAIARKRGLEN